MLDAYKLRMAALGSYEGESKRRNSQKIMDASWMRDAATKPVYVKWVDKGLPVVDDDDPVLYAKFNIKSYHNITGDEIAYLLQFRQEDMRNNPNIKVGSYVQIMNEMDEPEWWLICHIDDRTQFRQFSILKCLYTYKWVSHKNGKRVVHQCLGVPRNQNSYNSGVWLDYVFQVAENQHIALLPTNDDSRTLGYDTKMLVGDSKRYPPVAWKVSKISSSLNGDKTFFTMTQEQFNPATDNAELMIADYWQSAVDPEPIEMEEIPTVSELEIAYAGQPVVRAGGGYKKLSLKKRVNGELVDLSEDEAKNVTWNVNWNMNTGSFAEDKDLDPNSIVNKLEYMTIENKPNFITNNPCTIKVYPLKVKCTNEYSLIGNTFTVTATSGSSSKSLIMEVISL